MHVLIKALHETRGAYGKIGTLEEGRGIPLSGVLVTWAWVARQ